MIDSRDGGVYTDEDGEEHYQDKNGIVHLGMPPLMTNKKEKSGTSGWTIFKSKNHCALCGRLTCRGSCFK